MDCHPTPAMPDLATLALFAAASAALIVVPGPSVIYIVARSVDQGRSAGLVSAFGVQLGGLVHVAAATLGVSALIAASAEAFTALKVVGAVYLLVLGVKRLREGAVPTGGGAAEASRRRLFTQGVVVQVLNPKTAIFFVAFLPQFADPAKGAVAPQLALLGLVFLVIAFLSDSTWALVASAAARRLRTPRARPWTGRVSGGCFVALGALAATARRV
jgi:threonine/homoserine/homoserine lactone efflux protein